MRRVTGKVALLAGACAVGVLLLECGLRVAAPHGGFGSARELRQFRESGAIGALFTLDPAFGFRPVLGSALYSPYGTLRNEYAPEKPAGTTRLLFVGDSVTARGKIVAALRRRLGEAGVEYWNAGVESFNTRQEVAFYKRYNAAIHPDHVILTFHLNDFESTPVAFRDRRGRLHVYAPNLPARHVNGWLFRRSYLYRWWLGKTRTGDRQIDEVMAETRAALAELRDLLARDGIRFSVLVLPFLKPYTEWQPGDQFAHRAILCMLAELGIRHVDLYPSLAQALADGIKTREVATDDWHPSDAVSERFAAAVCAAPGLLAVHPVRGAELGEVLQAVGAEEDGDGKQEHGAHVGDGRQARRDATGHDHE